MELSVKYGSTQEVLVPLLIVARNLTSDHKVRVRFEPNSADGIMLFRAAATVCVVMQPLLVLLAFSCLTSLDTCVCDWVVV